jgi:hypothetical protein
MPVSTAVLLGTLVLRLSYLSKQYVDAAISAEAKQRLLDVRSREQGYYQNFERDLSFDDERDLARYWSENLDAEFTREHVRYLCNKIRQIESSCHGRLACNIQDAIIHVLLMEALSGKQQFAYLEIGCLYGVNSVMMHQFSKLLFEDVDFLLIDPLDGYYEKGMNDPFTGLPVSEAVLKANLAANFVAEEDYVLMKDYSFSQPVVEKASQKIYDYIFIDGDHSFHGIKKDCEIYIPLLAEGGVVVIDDYDHSAWPDVTQYVDEYLMQLGDLEYIGHAWKTVAFRKKAGQGVNLRNG